MYFRFFCFAQISTLEKQLSKLCEENKKLSADLLSSKRNMDKLKNEFKIEKHFMEAQFRREKSKMNDEFSPWFFSTPVSLTFIHSISSALNTDWISILFNFVEITAGATGRQKHKQPHGCGCRGSSPTRYCGQWKGQYGDRQTTSCKEDDDCFKFGCTQRNASSRCWISSTVWKV